MQHNPYMAIRCPSCWGKKTLPMMGMVGEKQCINCKGLGFVTPKIKIEAKVSDDQEDQVDEISEDIPEKKPRKKRSRPADIISD